MGILYHIRSGKLLLLFFAIVILPCQAQDSIKKFLLYEPVPNRQIPDRLQKFRFDYNAGKQQQLSYYPQKKFGFITSLPNDFRQFGKMSFSGKSIPAIVLIAGTTALLIPSDQRIINALRQFSDNIHLRPETDYIEILELGDVHIFRLPKNLNTAFYQAGQGFTSMLLAGGLYAHGLIKKDYRSVSVAGQLTESFIMMAIITQIIKRSTGRESPFMATRSGGAWNPFPSFSDYQQNTSAYDAMPSGHLATMMSAITILIDNYPEKKWIAPVGYIIMGLSAFAMMNTEVHWASDYPLAIGLGYVCGKVVSMKHKKLITKKAFVP